MTVDEETALIAQYQAMLAMRNSEIAELRRIIETKDEAMSKGDGKNLKFRVLCKRCNSYRHTAVVVRALFGARPRFHIECSKCGNKANSFEEEADVS